MPLLGPYKRQPGARNGAGENGGSIRNIVELPRRPDGLFKQPDWSKMSAQEIAEYATGMQKRRMSAAHLADYADQITGLTNTSDPTGNYVCGGCNKRDNRGDGKRCLSVKNDNLDVNTGSCNKWEIECAGDPEHDNQAISIEEAGYVVGVHPFGCARCTLQEPSGFVDELDRSLWCGEWAVTVHPKRSCCAMNDTPELELNADGSVKQSQA